MATKLKNLKITSVDLVDRGANPDAYVELFKRDAGTEQPKEVKPETKPETIEKASETEDKTFWKSVVSKITKLFINDPETDKEKDIKKYATSDSREPVKSFQENLLERRRTKICDELWDYIYSLQQTLCMVISSDATTEEISTKFQDALEAFNLAITDAKDKWIAGESYITKSETAPTQEFISYSINRLNTMAESIHKNVLPEDGGHEPMIDRSKMSAGELAIYDEIVKKYTLADHDKTTPEAEPAAAATDPAQVEKAAPAAEEKPQEPADPYAHLNPVVKAEIEALRKRADEAEEKELQEIAKKYEIIGKKPEDLVPVLKSLKKSDEKAYNEMISIMDASVEAVEKSALFGEIGRSGHGAVTETEEKIQTIAKGYVEKDPSMSMETAIAKAWTDHPELLDQYDSEY
ncbi:MAG TPA: hypothetical protein DHV42_01125 [Lachnospiraceae bacterium]|nr:hypothetical protein [Lachnospiraceae bacterium]